MYLSTKPGIKPYQIVGLFNSDLKLSKLNVLQLIKLLSIRNKTEKRLIKPSNYDIINNFVENVSKQKKIIKKEIKFKPLEITDNQEYDEQLIRNLLNLLNQDRVENYYDWIKIGMILHYCSVSDKNKKINYFELWNKWSAQSNKYSTKS